MQVDDGSPLRELPPQDFYTKDEPKKRSFKLFRSGQPDDASTIDADIAIDADIEVAKDRNESVWNDLEVLKPRSDGNEAQREFLTAMQVEESSGLAGKTLAQAGIDKLPGLFLVSIDRPYTVPDSQPPIQSFNTIQLTE